MIADLGQLGSDLLQSPNAPQGAPQVAQIKLPGAASSKGPSGPRPTKEELAVITPRSATSSGRQSKTPGHLLEEDSD